MNRFQEAMLCLGDYITKADVPLLMRARIVIVFPTAEGKARFDMTAKRDGIGYNFTMMAVEPKETLPPNISYRIADIDIITTSTQEIAEQNFRIDPYGLNRKIK